jgi:hypothetical protein
MKDGFIKAVEGLRLVNEGQKLLINGVAEALDGAVELEKKIDDLSEHIKNLETIIIEQGNKVTELYNRLPEDEK